MQPDKCVNLFPPREGAPTGTCMTEEGDEGFCPYGKDVNAQVQCNFYKGSEKPADRLKELAIKASDLDAEFGQLAKKCAFFYLEDKENAQIFHDLQLKFCSHRHRLGTKKNPKRCNLLACPLKYKVVGGNHG